MRKKELAFTAIIVALSTISFQGTVHDAQAANENSKQVEMYRLYNPNTGEHFYTASMGERNSLITSGWTYEGIGWNAPKTGTPVYRVYNSHTGDHHYTTNLSERNVLVHRGWRNEGVGWQSGGTIPIYRQYNPHAKLGTHNYTTSKAENDMLLKSGWRSEGIGWYGLKNSAQTTYTGSIPKDALTTEYMRTFFYIVEDCPAVNTGTSLLTKMNFGEIIQGYANLLLPKNRWKSSNPYGWNIWSTEEEVQTFCYALSSKFDGQIPDIGLNRKGKVYYFGGSDGTEIEVRIKKVRYNVDKSADVDVEISYENYPKGEKTDVDRYHMIPNPHVDTTSSTPFYYSIDKITRLTA